MLIYTYYYINTRRYIIIVSIAISREADIINTKVRWRGGFDPTQPKKEGA